MYSTAKVDSHVIETMLDAITARGELFSGFTLGAIFVYFLTRGVAKKRLHTIRCLQEREKHLDKQNRQKDERIDKLHQRIPVTPQTKKDNDD